MITCASVAPGARSLRGQVLVVDSYDSFTYNLAQQLAALGASCTVLRNDCASVAEIAAAEPAGVVLSPGPGRPEAAGVCVELVRQLGSTVAVLGVCLGHQAIGVAFGARVVRAPAVVHGKVAPVRHHGAGVLRDLDDPLLATRYHSLVIDADSVPADLEVTAWSEDGLVMAVRHRRHPVEGVQFHPESVGTPCGPQLLRNFLLAADAGLCRAPASA